MTNLYKWKHGQVVKGTHANRNLGMKNYRNDINRAWGREDDYYNGGVIYIDTFSSNLAEQLAALKS